MKMLTALAVTLAMSGAAFAQMSHGDMPMSHGTITKIDTKWNKVTIDHGPLESLAMPAMKMVFDLADPSMMDSLSEGQEITFSADRVNGKLTVTEIATE